MSYRMLRSEQEILHQQVEYERNRARKLEEMLTEVIKKRENLFAVIICSKKKFICSKFSLFAVNFIYSKNDRYLQ